VQEICWIDSSPETRKSLAKQDLMPQRNKKKKRKKKNEEGEKVEGWEVEWKLEIDLLKFSFFFFF